jgi:hypothetical protein
MNAVPKIAWETTVLKTVPVLRVNRDTKAGIAMKAVLKTVRSVSNLITNVYNVKTDGEV